MLDFWNENFWLPPNVGWKDINTETGPKVADLWYCLPIAALLVVFRYFYETLVLKPIGNYYGLYDKAKVKVVPNKILENTYISNRKPDSKAIVALSKQTDLTTRQIDRWFRRRNLQDKSSKLSKFSECGWRATFFFIIFFYGVAVLYNKSWLTNTKELWIDWPNHSLTSSIYWYYIVELGFYISLIATAFFDAKRKDFYEMLFHHFVAAALIAGSFSNNFVRCGCLVLVLHDCADGWLEIAKMAKYVQKQTLCDFFFGFFTLNWLVTRLTMFPLWILNTTIFELGDIVGRWGFYYVFNCLLLCLQVLHWVWFYYIGRGAYLAITKGQVGEDERSDIEQTVSETTDEDKKNCNHKNGVLK